MITKEQAKRHLKVVPNTALRQPLEDIIKYVNNCDGGHETKEDVRYLSTGDDGGLYVCFTHYRKEYVYCAYNVGIGLWSKDKLDNFPKWESLKLYVP